MMSTEEKETLNSIAKVIKAAKVWIPVIVFLCTGFWFAVKLGVSAQSTYDNDIAKKDDIKKLCIKTDELTELVKTLVDERHATSEKANRADSISMANQARLSAHIIQENKRIQKLTASFAYFTERYTIDGDGKRVIKVIPHNN